MQPDVTPDSNQQDPQVSAFQTAHNYFEQAGAMLKGTGSSDLDPNIRDADGMVSYITLTTPPPPPEWQQLHGEIMPVMEGLASILVGYIVGRGQGRAIHDPQTWRTPIEKLPGYKSASSSRSSINKKVRGVDVPAQIFEVLANARVNKSHDFDSFQGFLREQGDSIIRFAGNPEYRYACISLVHEFFELNGIRDYNAKIIARFTRFSSDTIRLARSCKSTEEFNFNFDMDVITADFDMQSWQGSGTMRNQIRNFIDRAPKANIQDSVNYFNGIFSSSR